MNKMTVNRYGHEEAPVWHLCWRLSWLLRRQRPRVGAGLCDLRRACGLGPRPRQPADKRRFRQLITRNMRMCNASNRLL
jgi:hypothetical protein